MKKILIVLVLLLFSCSLEIRDREGFRLFRYIDFIHENNVCLQSLEGYEYSGLRMTEGVFDSPATIQNPHDHEISLKVTDHLGSFYITMEGNATYVYNRRNR
jgi:hypothetical protein